MRIPKKTYFPNKGIPWDALNPKINPSKAMGKFFIPVFTSKKECKQEYPDCEILTSNT